MTSREALKEIGKYNCNGVLNVCDIQEYEIIEKSLEALKLVIRKGVETYWLEHTKTVDEYNKKIANLRETFSLSEEEYKLVKEVFENDK